MKKNKIIKTFTITLLLVVSKSGWSYPIDMPGFNMLPPHCQAKYAEMYKMGKVEGIVINPDKYKPELWAKRVGNAWVHFHHYCPALIDLNKLKFGGYKSPIEKKSLMDGASGNIEYTISHTALDAQGAWIIAEANLKLAEFNELTNNDGVAVNLYNKAIHIYPRYIQAYADLSELYKKMGMNSEAKEMLEKAIKIKPNSKELRRRLAKLEK